MCPVSVLGKDVCLWNDAPARHVAGAFCLHRVSRNELLFLDPQADPDDDACYDLLEDTVESTPFRLGEYIGIAVREMGDGAREVWTSYTGTMDEGEQDEQESIIWATRIPWLNP